MFRSTVRSRPKDARSKNSRLIIPSLRWPEQFRDEIDQTSCTEYTLHPRPTYRAKRIKKGHEPDQVVGPEPRPARRDLIERVGYAEARPLARQRARAAITGLEPDAVPVAIAPPLEQRELPSMQGVKRVRDAKPACRIGGAGCIWCCAPTRAASVRPTRSVGRGPRAVARAPRPRTECIPARLARPRSRAAAAHGSAGVGRARTLRRERAYGSAG